MQTRRGLLGLSSHNLISEAFQPLCYIILLLLIVQNLSAADDSTAGLTIIVPAFFAAVLLFIATEGFWTRNPLIPLHLLKTSLEGYGVNQVLILFSRSGVSFRVIKVHR